MFINYPLNCFDGSVEWYAKGTCSLPYPLNVAFKLKGMLGVWISIEKKFIVMFGL